MAISLGNPLFSMKEDSGNNKNENNRATVNGMKNVLPTIKSARITAKIRAPQATLTIDD